MKNNRNKNSFLSGKLCTGRMATIKRKGLVLPALIAALSLSNCKKEVLPAAAANVDGTVTAANVKRTQALPANIPSKDEALLAMDVFNNNFYNDYGAYGASRKAYYWHDQMKTTREFFWVQCETIETLEDAYTISSKAEYKDKINYLFNGLVDQSGPLWSANKYNDDILWGSIMAIRAYQITNDPAQLAVAKNNFDLVWNRSWDTNTLGGGIWWTTDNATKNVVSNAPAVIAAMEIFKITGDATYKDKAKLVMDWMVSKLYIPATGEVKGAINAAGTITEGPLSYTQGTFIGAANELRPYYTSTNYLAMGMQAMDYARSSMCVSPGSYLKDESSSGTGDTQGIKSIFARWACAFVKDTNTANNYGAWLDLNAKQAWSIRNNSGLMWDNWSLRTLDILPILNDWQTNGGVSMMLNLYRFR